ncbi:hypothetical protein ULMS_12650 [Patiriisocius marinistellae]|uniref:Uncharacterized protein n=1 Tax=Patiriisocius marinistellae TaxID=2494560 RepID=A0A5J4FTF8_9FLAO|nr:hypothetical protein [Patiriisocius marinistellae]GEQ85757.1 hypothetical protein ULMS_12650 [Patiriisocius marinistellae]
MSEFKDNFSSLKLITNTGYQLLLTSSLYGTNFAIFGKFSLEKDGNKSIIKKIDTKLYNYKGILNLGFSTKHETEVTLQTSGQDSYINIKFYIRAVVCGDEQISETESSPLTEYRSLVTPKNTIKITDPYYLRAERELIPISGSLEGSPITNGVFDSEFYYRDGAKYIVRNIREIPKAETQGIDVKNINESLFNETGPGIICRESSFHLVLK